MRGFSSLQTYLAALARRKQLQVIRASVDARLEIAEIHRRVVAQGGPALLFENVRGSAFPLATNLFGTAERLEFALGGSPEEVLEPLLKVLKSGQLPSLKDLWRKRSWLMGLPRGGLRVRPKGPVADCALEGHQFSRLPLLTAWPMDGGPFLTLPLVLTQNPADGSHNLGIYRMQRLGSALAGMHWQIGKGGGFHHWQAEREGKDLPVTVLLGGAPALTLSAIAPLPENVSELLLASWLLEGPLQVVSVPETPHPIPAECEFALIGKCPANTRKLEGPFGDHYGYYSLAHDFPTFACERILHRKGAIMPATVVGPPPQEDLYLGDYLQRAIAPLIPIAMPGVRALWSYSAGGFHSLSAAVVRERYERESLAHAFRILGEGQLSLTKCLLLVDEPIDLTSLRAVFTHLLARFAPETDCYVFPNLSMDTLDYAGPRLNRGSKAVLLGTGAPRRALPQQFSSNDIPLVGNIAPFCPGCLVMSAPKGRPIDIATLLRHPSFDDWPLLLLVEDALEAVKSEMTLIWSVFTRFDPATDIHAREAIPMGNHLMRRGPLLIDARAKVNYPPLTIVDPATAYRVSKRWGEYFPGGIAGFPKG